jgi:uncharacterized alkaline shock family protein YloU
VSADLPASVDGPTIAPRGAIRPSEAGSRPFARAVRDAVLQAPDVAGLSAGILGEIATYLPGDRVAGVRVADDGVHVHVVITTAGAERIPAVAGAVHGAVQHVLRKSGAPDAPGPGVAVHVHVEDVAVTSGGGNESRKDER